MIPRTQRDQVRDGARKTNHLPGKQQLTDNESPGQPSHERDIDARPTGLPTSDRHAVETAHQWEPETEPAGETQSGR